jgi:hypothetical protein
MTGNGSHVKVVLRIKPLDLEEGTRGSRSVVDIVSESSIKIESLKQFTFDSVFSGLSTQAQIFNRSTKELADQFLDGFNCTVFSYGQSGSGKVYNRYILTFRHIQPSVLSPNPRIYLKTKPTKE